MSTYFTIPGVEIELRFGSISKNFQSGKEFFDNNIDKNYFEKILYSFETYNKWQNIFTDNSVEYILNNKKTIVRECGTNIIVKNKLYKKDSVLKNIPFDVRFSINQELNNNIIDNVNINTDSLLIRKKSRKSFEDFNFRYDMSYVVEISNNISKDKYEVELEILINNETLEWDNKYLNDFIICKIQDIVNILDEKDTVLQKNLIVI